MAGGDPATHGDELTPVAGRQRWRLAGRIALLALLAALPAACALQELLGPRVPAEWNALIEDIRGFERRIGFHSTDNFRSLSEERKHYFFCGYASPLVLPYSYEDPAIRWRDVATKEECATLSAGADIYFGRVEALGEIGTPVTLSMVSSRLDRFIYVVIHEDCHDQFDLPYGIEEALCNVLAYKAMADFTDEKFGARAREDRAARRYVEGESRRTRETKDYYEQLELLYARHQRNEVSSDALLRERAWIFVKAGWSMAWRYGPLNNVILASHMTYSRHYAFLESVLDAHHGDLARAVAFFKRVDRVKPSPAAIMGQRGLASSESVEFIRAYEAAVVDTIRTELATGVHAPRIDTGR
jgi:hypothetical protein